MARVPQNGRNFEYLSGEDPYLGKPMVKAVVNGIQSKGKAERGTERNSGIMATAKHWVNNNQETNRMTVSANVSTRVEKEMYFVPFEGAIEARAGSFMCSYNRINGTWSCENDFTLNQQLKKELGFNGFVMSDWWATHSLSLMQGLDQEQPDSMFINETSVTAMVQNG